jgi:hypothetical protein
VVAICGTDSALFYEKKFGFLLVLAEVCVQYPIWFFFCTLLMCFLGMLLSYFLNDFEIVPFAPIITAMAFVLHYKCDVFLL